MTMLGKGGWIKQLDAWTIKKSRQSKVVGVEPRASGDLHRSEKPGWSAGCIDK